MLFSQCNFSSEILSYQEIYKIIDKDYSDYYPDLGKDNKFTQMFIEKENEKLINDAGNKKDNFEIKYIKNLCKELPFHLVKDYIEKIGEEQEINTFGSKKIYNFYRNCYNDLDDYSKKDFVENIKGCKTKNYKEAEKINKIRHCEDYILENTDCEIVKVRNNGKFGIVEVDKINEILNEEKYNKINDELKRNGIEKVLLNLSQIDDNEYISIDYENDSFKYPLPFTINMENTKEQITEKIKESKDKIETNNITINENGLICGNNFKTYEDALDTFMSILQKIRRNI